MGLLRTTGVLLIQAERVLSRADVRRSFVTYKNFTSKMTSNV